MPAKGRVRQSLPPPPPLAIPSLVPTPAPSQFLPRSSGLLLHITSLPGSFGIGDLGPAAFEFIDALSRAKQTWWQTLPLGPHQADGGPYGCYSAMAGNPALISPELLARDGLLDASDLPPLRSESTGVLDVGAAARKYAMLSRTLEKLRAGHSTPASQDLRDEFESFRAENAEWLEDYALFMAIGDHRGRRWHDWPGELIERDSTAMNDARRELAAHIELHQFAQFIFFRQLAALRAYAGSRGIKLLGDLPMFISPNSADVWSHPELFLLDKKRRPTAVSGVPPDYFSETGQLWGNPLYNWPEIRRRNFDWWIARAKAALKQADIVRIDHFRALSAYWKIPARATTAAAGHWVKAPGRAFLKTLNRELGHLPFIVEDLGLITPDVEKLRDDFHLPGMRILQFAFSGSSDNPFLPHNYRRNCVAYTGTHDNDTSAGWFAKLDEPQKRALHQYAGQFPDNDAAWSMIRLAWTSVANLAIAPVQDLLGLNSEARMNTPGTDKINWKWRLFPGQIDEQVLDRLAELTEATFRSRH